MVTAPAVGLWDGGQRQSRGDKGQVDDASPRAGAHIGGGALGDVVEVDVIERCLQSLAPRVGLSVSPGLRVGVEVPADDGAVSAHSGAEVAEVLGVPEFVAGNVHRRDVERLSPDLQRGGRDLGGPLEVSDIQCGLY
ncbi:hypothetical protein ANAPC5_01221 [Anaplasma phagocytophilum]|nr:hypothetical protein ANAPC5_01221 [Anaplasma phagocytophilum]